MIRDTDKGAKALVGRSGHRGSVKVGVIGATASKSHGGISNVEIAMFHEFGLGVPQRSFVAGYIDENNAQIVKVIRKFAKQVVAGKITFGRALELTGLYAQGGIQQRIANRIPPPLADSTIDRKGSDVPLIDTGQLRSSITYEVEDG